jgi:hypothetical protein
MNAMNALENTVDCSRSWEFICGPNLFFHIFQSLSDPIHHLGPVPAKAWSTRNYSPPNEPRTVVGHPTFEIMSG